MSDTSATVTGSKHIGRRCYRKRMESIWPWLGKDGRHQSDDFLVDTAADRSVFSADLLKGLQFTGNHAHPGFELAGIGGNSPCVFVTTVVEFTRDDGGPARVHGEYAAFTDPR